MDQEHRRMVGMDQEHRRMVGTDQRDQPQMVGSRTRPRLYELNPPLCQGHSGPSLINTPNECLYMVCLSQRPGN